MFHSLVDCESHATTLDDERIMLSAYLADLACAPAARVTLLHGAEIQLLPGKAINSILGDTGTQKYAFREYQAAQVAERELTLGLV